MNDQPLRPDKEEKEVHIITERIIEEPRDEEQEGSLFEEYIVKGAGFALGATIFLLVAFAVIKLIFQGGILSTFFGILLGLLIIAGILEHL